MQVLPQRPYLCITNEGKYNMQVITVSVVNFKAQYGNKSANAERIAEYSQAAAAQGTDMVVFPEMALTGFDNELDIAKPEKMQVRCAETVPGPSTDFLAETAKKYGVYIVFGMPERDMAVPDTIYNSAVVLGPEGLICCHRKTHISYPESQWAAKGNRPTVFDTPWGAIGLAICYEVYRYPEFIRYARAKGAGLFLNCTAASRAAEPPAYMSISLETSAMLNRMFIASANLTGPDLVNDFFGGSSIIGPSFDDRPARYYAGVPFSHQDSRTPGIFTATIDLSEIDNNRTMYRNSPDYGEPDFKPLLFAEMYRELAELPGYRQK